MRRDASHTHAQVFSMRLRNKVTHAAPPHKHRQRKAMNSAAPPQTQTAKSNEMEQEGKRYAFDNWKYNHYFEFVSAKGKNISVRCTLCVGKKILSTADTTTSNLKKHLDSQHSNVKLIEKVPAVPHPPNSKSWTFVENHNK